MEGTMRTFLSMLVVLVGLSPVVAEAQDAPAAGASSSEATAPTAETGHAALMHPSTILSPGILGTVGGGRSVDFGIGAQLRLDYYPTTLPMRVGGWITGEVLGDSSMRAAGGLTGGMWIFDCQVGVAYRSATDHYAGSLGLVIGKTINFGWVSIGGRITIPLVDFTSANGAQQTQGIEGTFVLGFSMPQTLDGTARNPLDCPRHAMRDACPCHRRGSGAASDVAEAAEEPEAPAATTTTPS
jgi:hypothetical protein